MESAAADVTEEHAGRGPGSSPGVALIVSCAGCCVGGSGVTQ